MPQNMAGTLTISSKLSPFPFAAIAIASYTGNVDVIFDESATEIVLEFNGSKIKTEENIVLALANVSQLPQDDSIVRDSPCSLHMN